MTDQSTLASNDGFTKVTFKYRKQIPKTNKKKKAKNQIKYQHSKDWSTEDLLAQLLRYRETLLACAFYDQLLTSVQDHLLTRDIKDIVCYGIGSMEDSIPARYQFMLILLLKERLKIPGQIFIYDPVMSNLDKQVSEHYGLKVISTNEDCKRQVSVSTLFYMPHCTREHYNNVLASNWDAEHLEHITLIGNDLTDIQPDNVLQQKCPLLLKAAGLIQSIPFPAHLFDINNVFNNTSIQTFPTPIII
ncbi:SRR1-domain-containing protein [Hesseltinella vesiculosa]|uniref:SRR1-domain-containing protein n=1 Tax=Hesseltinella vesiculosa TaxID=101127 RepID=A0A1X2GKN3_9FUNG|nr:SRR1-domain-containing protein [Hesseltinella vesiculosa]